MDHLDNKLNQLKTILMEQVKNKSVPLPRIIHVETRSKCNGTCGFCPASTKTDTRKDILMPDNLIEKIINELSKLHYKDRLSFYNNNEPFIDKRIFEIIKLAREKLPKTYLELKSNGIVLNMDKIITIFNNGLDTLYISDYTDSDQYSDNILSIKNELTTIRRFKGHLEGSCYFKRIIITHCGMNIKKGTRAGSSPNREKLKHHISAPCFRPFEMMTISPEGKVSVCSEDFYHAMFVGNIQNDNLINIWQSDKWNTIRNELLNNHRHFTHECSMCDYKGFTYEMLAEHNLFDANDNITPQFQPIKKEDASLKKVLFSHLKRYFNR